MHLSANKTQISQIAVKSRTWDWTSAILLILVIFFASGRLVATNWTEHLLQLLTLALMAAVFGLALGQSIFPRWAAVLLGILYGAFFVPWQLTRLLF